MFLRIFKNEGDIFVLYMYSIVLELRKWFIICIICIIWREKWGYEKIVKKVLDNSLMYERYCKLKYIF